MNEDARVELQSVVRAGEPLVWTGRPDPAWRWRRGDLAATGMGVAFAAFITVWMTLVISKGAPIFMPLFGSVFVAFALWMLVGRWFHRAARARRTAYGLTPTQAYIVVKGSVTTHRLDESLVIRRSPGHVDVVFAEETRAGRGWTAEGNTGAEYFLRGRYDAAFYDVADVDALLAALDRIQRDADRRGSQLSAD